MSNVHPFPYEDEAEPRRPSLEDVAEQWLIGAVLDDPRGYQIAAEIIDRSDIASPGYRLIWDVAGQLVTEQRAVHHFAVRREIEAMGRLRDIGGGRLIDDLSALNIPSGTADYFAEKVAKKARAYRASAFAVRYRQAADDPETDGKTLDKLLAEHLAGETERTERAANPGGGPAHLMKSLLDWGPFFATDFGSIKLMLGRLMAPGQQITLVGDGKAGKSLFMQEWAWRMATGRGFLDDRPQAPIRILYLDAENGQEQIQERLASFGASPDEDLSHLHYASFPPIRPLDTPGGGQDVLTLAAVTGAQLVILDTVSRFISGPENEADTWLSLYRHTLMPLKAAGLSSVRLDHFGKDKERGGRGSSAKTQDVDHVWELVAQSSEILTLKRTHTRTGVGPGIFTLIRRAKQDGDRWIAGETRHEVMHGEQRAVLVPGSPEHVAAQLDQAGVPAGYGREKLRSECNRLGIPVRTDTLTQVAALRKSKAGQTGTSDLTQNLTQGPYMTPDPIFGSASEETPGQTRPNTPRVSSGQVATGPDPLTPPLGGGQVVGPPRPTRPCCDICGGRLAPELVERNIHRHVMCTTDPNDQ